MTQTAFDITVDGWGTHDFSDATTGVLTRDVSPLILEVLRRDPTFLGTIGVGTPAKNRKVEWFERDWIPFQFTSDTDIPNDTVDIDLTVCEHNMGKWLTRGTKLMLTGRATATAGSTPTAIASWTPGEVFHCTKVDLTTLGATGHCIVTVARQYGASPLSTTAPGAPITTNGLEFEIMGAALPENSSPGSDQSRGFGPAIVNYTEIDGFDLDVSGTSMAMDVFGMSDFYGTNLKELTEELKLRLNRKAIYGLPLGLDTAPYGETYAGSDTQVQTMGGLKYYLNRTGGNVISTGYTTPTEELINHMCRMIIAKNGSLNNRKGSLLCSPANAEIFGDLWKDKIHITREDTVRGVQVKSILTKLGFMLDIVWDQNMRNNDLIIYNPSKVEIAPLRGRAWFVKKYDNGKDGQSARVIGEWTMRVRDSLKDHAICTCLTTPAA